MERAKTKLEAGGCGSNRGRGSLSGLFGWDSAVSLDLRDGRFMGRNSSGTVIYTRK